MRRNLWVTVVVMGVWSQGIFSPFAFPQDGTRVEAQESSDSLRVFATVQGHPIGLAEVRFLLSQVRPTTTGQQEALDQWLPPNSTTGPTSNPTEIPSEVVTAAVDQWIERFVVLSFLEREGLAVPRAKTEADLKAWDDRLRELGSSLDAYRARSGITAESLFHFRHWELSWQSYLDRRVTDDSLQRFFQENKADFDGTRKRVAHVVRVIPPLDPTRPNAVEARADLEKAAQAELANVRQQIVSGKKSFAEAAAEYSEGTSAEQGGDLGWIVREAPLSEVVSRAAFRLNRGEISPPIVSPHGVHLLTVLEETPGPRTYEQVAEQVKNAAIQKLWRMIQEQESGNLSIQRHH
ncbi:MAG: peptidylprolyl isomerase [Planctomycetaceae bacterium]|nr:peptidylprolyl isomerase [Planctomycetaceae bacterium]